MPNTKLLAALTAFALLGTGGLSASGVHPALSAKHQSAQRIVSPSRGTDLLYGQSDNDNGQGIVAQNFETAFDAYDSEAADDFTVPAGKIWKVTEIHVDGTYFDGAGSADSFNVSFYASKTGALIQSCPDASYYFDTQADLGSEYIRCAARLKKGRYFVAIQANMDFSAGGQWGWLTNDTVRQRPSLWRNPADGFQTGCIEFEATATCIDAEEGGDFSFALYGRAKDARAAAPPGRG
jgi:hypothetical protein